MSDETLPSFLTVIEFAELTRVSKWAVYDAVNAGQVRAIRVGRQVRIPRSELERLVAGG